MRVSNWCLALICTFVSAAAVSAAAADSPEDAAAAAALVWFSSLDEGQYEATWTLAAPLFKSHVTQQAWVKILGTWRSTLGLPQSRTLIDGTYKSNLDGALTELDYVAIHFRSSLGPKESPVLVGAPKGEFVRIVTDPSFE